MKFWIWDKTRTEMRFFGVLCNKRSNGGGLLGDVLHICRSFEIRSMDFDKRGK